MNIKQRLEFFKEWKAKAIKYPFKYYLNSKKLNRQTIIYKGSELSIDLFSTYIAFDNQCFIVDEFGDDFFKPVIYLLNGRDNTGAMIAFYGYYDSCGDCVILKDYELLCDNLSSSYSVSWVDDSEFNTIRYMAINYCRYSANDQYNDNIVNRFYYELSEVNGELKRLVNELINAKRECNSQKMVYSFSASYLLLKDLKDEKERLLKNNYFEKDHIYYLEFVDSYSRFLINQSKYSKGI